MKRSTNGEDPFRIANTKTGKRAKVAILKMIDQFETEARNLLQTIKTSKKSKLAKGKQRLIWWASLHANSSTHGPHNHVGYAVSGAYYSAVPSGSGMFQFSDPTGVGDTRGKEMQRGEMVVFPSYAEHSVSESTNKNQYRVSFSLNWGEMMDLSSGTFLH
jgi:hypothetical protein